MIWVFDHDPGYFLNEIILRFTNSRVYGPPAPLGERDILLYCRYFHNSTRFSLLQGEDDYERIGRNPNELKEEEPLDPDDDLLEVLTRENGYLFLCNTWEYFPIFSPQFQRGLAGLLNHLGVPSEKVIISCCEAKYMGRNFDSGIKAFGFDWAFLREKLNFVPGHVVDPAEDKSKHFIFLNRRYSDDRFLIFLHILKNGFSDKFHMSFLSMPPEGSLEWIENQARLIDVFGSDREATARCLREAVTDLPYVLDGLHMKESFTVLDKIKDSHFFIINETIPSSHDYLFVSEKTYIPIKHGMPFLIFGSRGVLAHLHRLGFKTFHPLIDERYDQEGDYFKRLNLFIREIDRLCRIDIAEIRSLHEQMRPVIQHNLNHLVEQTNIGLLEDAILKWRN
jgi:hypothetical protein